MRVRARSDQLKLDYEVQLGLSESTRREHAAYAAHKSIKLNSLGTNTNKRLASHGHASTSLGTCDMRRDETLLYGY